MRIITDISFPIDNGMKTYEDCYCHYFIFKLTPVGQLTRRTITCNPFLTYLL